MKSVQHAFMLAASYARDCANFNRSMPFLHKAWARIDADISAGNQLRMIVRIPDLQRQTDKGKRKQELHPAELQSDALVRKIACGKVKWFYDCKLGGGSFKGCKHIFHLFERAAKQGVLFTGWRLL